MQPVSLLTCMQRSNASPRAGAGSTPASSALATLLLCGPAAGGSGTGAAGEGLAGGLSSAAVAAAPAAVAFFSARFWFLRCVRDSLSSAAAAAAAAAPGAGTAITLAAALPAGAASAAAGAAGGAAGAAAGRGGGGGGAAATATAGFAAHTPCGCAAAGAGTGVGVGAGAGGGRGGRPAGAAGAATEGSGKASSLASAEPGGGGGAAGAAASTAAAASCISAASRLPAELALLLPQALACGAAEELATLLLRSSAAEELLRSAGRRAGRGAVGSAGCKLAGTHSRAIASRHAWLSANAVHERLCGTLPYQPVTTAQALVRSRRQAKHPACLDGTKVLRRGTAAQRAPARYSSSVLTSFLPLADPAALSRPDAAAVSLEEAPGGCGVGMWRETACSEGCGKEERRGEDRMAVRGARLPSHVLLTDPPGASTHPQMSWQRSWCCLCAPGSGSSGSWQPPPAAPSAAAPPSWAGAPWSEPCWPRCCGRQGGWA